MATNGPDEVIISGSNEAECSETMVEIKIKTLDSQTFTLRVNKCVPVPALKQQIATVTGVLSEQQRLICRGKVLKDDQLLSAYHVEDGHTLHLVVRQPLQSSSPPGISGLESAPAADPASEAARNRVAHSVVLGTFNLAEQGDGLMPDLNRIVSAVLSSIGITGPAAEGVGVVREYVPERLDQTPSAGGIVDMARSQTDQVPQRDATHDASHLPTGAPSGPPHATVIPDSLSTLSQYLSSLRREFSVDGRISNNNAGASDIPGVEGQHSGASIQSSGGQGPMPTPASLAEVVHSAQRLLTEQASGCLLQLARQLEDQTNINDSLARTNIQSSAMRSGVLLQNLGALLLELGRTTMTLRMGRLPSEAVVNAGPAIFISRSGPNPIMVQPLPFQPGTSFGSFPGGGASSVSGGSLGSGLLPRNIDIRIRTGPLMPNVNAVPGEQVGGSQQPPAQVGMTRDASSGVRTNASTGDAGMRVLPVRTVVAAVPATNRSPDSANGGNGIGLFYPLLARFQHLRGGLLGSGDGASQTGHLFSSTNGFSVLSDMRTSVDTLVPQQQASDQIRQSQTQASNVMPQNGQESRSDISSRFDQLLRTIFPGEEFHVSTGEVNLQHSMSVAGATREQQGGPEEPSGVTDEGLLFSNLLQQVMPVISQSINETAGSTHPPDLSIDPIEVENPCDAGSSHLRRDPPSPPDSKRQKME
ncbi:ubiquitin-like domain-containing protein CIP73 isoform X2 [Aristolochia californica]|uniref:ubiquitin-like domain-containing protein CIP73 isoform X2 n=1 Tax=Aristolochia californica TaxID=171875 RepID=UPI0035D7D3A2